MGRAANSAASRPRSPGESQRSRSSRWSRSSLANVSPDRTTDVPSALRRATLPLRRPCRMVPAVRPTSATCRRPTRAIRLYDRVMCAHERGRADTVADLRANGNRRLPDDRHARSRSALRPRPRGRGVGRRAIARAQADTILASNPKHLLGLILAANAARMRKDAAAERSLHDKLVAAAPAERAKQLPEYATHENDITIALDARSRP